MNEVSIYAHFSIDAMLASHSALSHRIMGSLSALDFSVVCLYTIRKGIKVSTVPAERAELAFTLDL